MQPWVRHSYSSNLRCRITNSLWLVLKTNSAKRHGFVQYHQKDVVDASVGRSSHILIAAAGKLEPGAIRDGGGLVLLRLHMFVNAQLYFGVFLHKFLYLGLKPMCDNLVGDIRGPDKKVLLQKQVGWGTRLAISALRASNHV